jgi:hypothetical protein
VESGKRRGYKGGSHSCNGYKISYWQSEQDDMYFLTEIVLKVQIHKTVVVF